MMDDRDEAIHDALRDAGSGWRFDTKEALRQVQSMPHPSRLQRKSAPAIALGLVLGVSSIVIAASLDGSRPEPPIQVPGSTSVGPAVERCAAPKIRPTYLPWLKSGQEVPPPHQTYDDTIDRAQLSWVNPNLPAGEGGVGLTVYTYDPASSSGEKTGVVILGADGRLHAADEGGVVGISWNLDRPSCNFIELSLAAPNLTSTQAVEELFMIARSLN